MPRASIIPAPVYGERRYPGWSGTAIPTRISPCAADESGLEEFPGIESVFSAGVTGGRDGCLLTRANGMSPVAIMAAGGISTTGGLLLLHPASASSANPNR